MSNKKAPPKKKEAPKKVPAKQKRKSDGRSGIPNPMNTRASRLDDASPDKHQTSRPEDWDDIEKENDDLYE